MTQTSPETRRRLNDWLNDAPKGHWTLDAIREVLADADALAALRERVKKLDFYTARTVQDAPYEPRFTEHRCIGCGRTSRRSTRQITHAEDCLEVERKKGEAR